MRLMIDQNECPVFINNMSQTASSISTKKTRNSVARDVNLSSFQSERHASRNIFFGRGTRSYEVLPSPQQTYQHSSSPVEEIKELINSSESKDESKENKHSSQQQKSSKIILKLTKLQLERIQRKSKISK